MSNSEFWKCGSCFTPQTCLHRDVKPSSAMFKCFLCGKIFSNSDKLHCHRLAHKKNKHSCIFCGELCNERIDMYIHLIACHQNGKTQTCRICFQETFESTADTKRHFMESHEREIRSVANMAESYCSIHSTGKVLDDSELQIELELFEKGYFPCCMCEKIFYTEDKIKAHLFAHTSGLHCCYFCSKLSDDKLDLYIHLADFHNLNKLCESCYTWEGDLRIHIKAEHGERIQPFLSKVELFCSIHSNRQFSDDDELQYELQKDLRKLNISRTPSETREGQMLRGNFQTRKRQTQCTLDYSPDQPGLNNSSPNTEELTKIICIKEEKQDVSERDCCSLGSAGKGSISAHNFQSEMQLRIPPAVSYTNDPTTSIVANSLDYLNFSDLNQEYLKKTSAFSGQFHSKRRLLVQPQPAVNHTTDPRWKSTSGTVDHSLHLPF